MKPNFAVIHQAFLAFVNEFDWIFNRDDVIPSGFVRVVHDSRQGCGLAAACRTSHEDETLMKAGEFLHDRRKTELVRCQNLRRNLPEYCGNAVFLIEEVC